MPRPGNGLTTRQKRILRFVVDYVDREGFAPSYREIAEAVAVTSMSSIHHQIHMLTDLGLLRAVPGVARAIDVRPARTAGYGTAQGQVAA